MTGNFDCTQLISIRCTEENEIEHLIKELFEHQGFEIIQKNSISFKKIECFSHYLFDVVFELKNDNFMGEFEDWTKENKPPLPILKFIESIKALTRCESILKFRVFLIYFADLDGGSTFDIKQVSMENLTEVLFSLSYYYFGCRYDGLILTYESSKR